MTAFNKGISYERDYIENMGKYSRAQHSMSHNQLHFPQPSSEQLQPNGYGKRLENL